MSDRPRFRPISDAPDWDTDGRDWPNRAASRFVAAAGLRWHVQIAGTGPVLLLAHGTGAATHSWAGLLPLLTERFTVVAPDLPGHGFTQAPPTSRLSLPGMAADLAALLATLKLRPALVAGHSAGAAVLLRMVLDGRIAPRAVVALNGALLPLRGVAGDWFAPLARGLALLPGVPRLFAWRAGDPALIRKLLDGTGSKVSPRQAGFYARLVRRPSHVGAALGMMANWNLVPLVRDLPRLAVPLHLLVGDRDRTIRPGEALRVRAILPAARIETLPGLGHLAHEERPDLVAALLTAAWPIKRPEPLPPGSPGAGSSKDF